jgi:hypothetical protein
MQSDLCCSRSKLRYCHAIIVAAQQFNPADALRAPLISGVRSLMSAHFKSLSLLGLCLLPAAVVAWLAYELTPLFIVTYAPYKAQLPPQASVLLAVYNWLWLVPLSLTLLAWFKWPHRNRRALAAAACGIASSAVVVGVAYWAAFQPKLILAAISAASNAP